MNLRAETALVFSCLSPGRLDSAREFLLSLPRMCRGALVEVDLGYRERARLVVCLVRTRGPDADSQRRIGFWCHVSGGRARPMSELAERARSGYRRVVAGCAHRLERVPAAMMAEAVSWLDRLAGGAGRARKGEARGTMVQLDLGRPESYDGVRYDALAGTLFLPSPISPPLGDAIPLVVRSGSREASFIMTRVIAHEAPGQAGPGMPGGYAVRIVEAPPHVLGLLAAWDGATIGKRRSAPRFAFRAPVKATPAAAPPQSTDGPPCGEDLEIVNLSQGGAFIRTQAAPAVGARLRLEFALPGGEPVVLDARVVRRDGEGVGVRFEGGREQEALLARSLALLATRPRRAMIVDDDVFVRETVGDALAERGYEVLKAQDGAAALRMVIDELLTLDVVITDLVMPNMDGESLVKAIRGAGGERDLAIVVTSGKGDPASRARLAAAGADAVVDKAAGPAALVRAADDAVRAHAAL